MFIDNLLFQDKKGGSSLFVGAGLLRQKTCGQGWQMGAKPAAVKSRKAPFYVPLERAGLAKSRIRC
jgi:hypothetical protein